MLLLQAVQLLVVVGSALLVLVVSSRLTVHSGPGVEWLQQQLGLRLLNKGSRWYSHTWMVSKAATTAAA
jgi:hypothetical protein